MHSSYIESLLTLSFSIPVSRQAFLDVTEADNPALGYGAKGLMGLGFTSLSNIDSVVNNTGSAEGRSLLYNLFAEHEDEPNFISFVLLRNSEIEEEMDGTFTLGLLYRSIPQKSSV